MKRSPIAAGDVFVSPGVQMFTAYLLDDRGDPTVERWAFANAEDDPNQGYGHLEVSVLEIVPTVKTGTLAVYRKQWFTPDGEPLNSGRRCIGGLSSLKALISRRKMTLAQAIEARSGETGTGSTEGESAVGTADAPDLHPALATFSTTQAGLTTRGETA